MRSWPQLLSLGSDSGPDLVEQIARQTGLSV